MTDHIASATEQPLPPAVAEYIKAQDWWYGYQMNAPTYRANLETMARFAIEQDRLLRSAVAVGDRFDAEELAELDRALRELSIALGNPAMIAAPPHSIESELIRYAVQRLSPLATEEVKHRPEVQECLDAIDAAQRRSTLTEQERADKARNPSDLFTAKAQTVLRIFDDSVDMFDEGSVRAWWNKHGAPLLDAIDKARSSTAFRALGDTVPEHDPVGFAGTVLTNDDQDISTVWKAVCRALIDATSWTDCHFIGSPPPQYADWRAFAGATVKMGVTVQAKTDSFSPLAVGDDLARYDMNVYEGQDSVSAERSDHGSWVRYDDAVAALRRSPLTNNAAQKASPIKSIGPALPEHQGGGAQSPEPSGAAPHSGGSNPQTEIETIEQALLEMEHAHCDPEWFSKGRSGADAQFRLWKGKGSEAVKALKAALSHSVPTSATDDTCKTCQGSGSGKAMTNHLGPDDYEVEVECPDCKGTGSRVSTAAITDFDEWFRKECPASTYSDWGRASKDYARWGYEAGLRSASAKPDIQLPDAIEHLLGVSQDMATREVLIKFESNRQATQFYEWVEDFVSKASRPDSNHRGKP